MRQGLKEGPIGSLLHMVQVRNDGGLQDGYCNREMRYWILDIFGMYNQQMSDGLVVRGRERI